MLIYSRGVAGCLMLATGFEPAAYILKYIEAAVKVELHTNTFIVLLQFGEKGTNTIPGYSDYFSFNGMLFVLCVCLRYMLWGIMFWVCLATCVMGLVIYRVVKKVFLNFRFIGFKSVWFDLNIF